MRVKVRIEKSFDDTKEFSKEYEQGDLQEFFDEEGMYLDDLAEIFKKQASDSALARVVYTVEMEGV